MPEKVPLTRQNHATAKPRGKPVGSTIQTQTYGPFSRSGGANATGDQYYSADQKGRSNRWPGTGRGSGSEADLASRKSARLAARKRGDPEGVEGGSTDTPAMKTIPRKSKKR